MGHARYFDEGMRNASLQPLRVQGTRTLDTSHAEPIRCVVYLQIFAADVLVADKQQDAPLPHLAEIDRAVRKFRKPAETLGPRIRHPRHRNRPRRTDSYCIQ